MKTANTAIATVEIDNTAWTLTPTSVALMGHELAAPTYGVAKDGDVYVYTAVEGSALRLHFDKRSPMYHKAFECAMAAKAQPKAEKPAEAKPAEPAKPVAETKPAEPAAKPTAKAVQPVAEAKPAKPAKQAKPAGKHAKAAAEPAKPVAETKPAKHAKAAAEPAAKPTANAVQPVAEAKPAKAAKPAKQAKPAAKPAPEPAKPVAEAKPAAEPAKPVDAAAAFEGKGWRIVYDEATQRTRVIADDPTPAQRSAIEAAGFWWSNTTKSWNKKLTRKAQRAAQALSETLTALDA